MPLYIRPALPVDQDAIVGLVRSERLNPNGLHWPNFLVATENDRLIGAVQLRRHQDGARELGSLVVERTSRGRGLAARLIDTLTAANPGRILMITARHGLALPPDCGIRRARQHHAQLLPGSNHRRYVRLIAAQADQPARNPGPHGLRMQPCPASPAVGDERAPC
jgi:amino-acid N-acetyltransferase